MKLNTLKKQTKKTHETSGQAVIRRQKANFERFMQERAGVFQVTESKAQALFWALG